MKQRMRSSTSRIIVLLATASLLSGLSLTNSCSHDSNPSDPQSLDRTAQVKYVIDGDTIVVGENEKVRYIGIDTPEIGECYYDEAKARNRELVERQQVFLDICEEEPTDKYGRTLAYVYVGDLLVNAELLSGGFAATLNIPPCNHKAAYFRDLQLAARTAKRGMWGACY